MIIYTKSSALKTFKLSSTLQELFCNFLFLSFSILILSTIISIFNWSKVTHDTQVF